MNNSQNSRDTSSQLLFDAPGPKGRRRIRVINAIGAVLIAALIVFVLMRLHNPPDGENQLSWELWKPALDGEAWADFYLPGLVQTLSASAVAIVGSVVFGLIFGVGRLIPNMLVRAVSGIVVEFCRAVPVLLMMIFMWRWFAAANIPSSSYWAVTLSLVLYNGSVVAELVRSGVGSLPGGQREAALALGLTRTRSLMTIEVPQALYAMLPAAITQLVVVLKDTALGSIILYTDLLQQSRRLGSMYFNILQALTIAAVLYFIMCFIVSRISEWLPAHIASRTSGSTIPDPTAPIAINDPSNVVRVKVARTPRPFGGAQPELPDSYGASGVTPHGWRGDYRGYLHDDEEQYLHGRGRYGDPSSVEKLADMITQEIRVHTPKKKRPVSKKRPSRKHRWLRSSMRRVDESRYIGPLPEQGTAPNDMQSTRDADAGDAGGTKGTTGTHSPDGTNTPGTGGE
ncbi:amino acid ABC transporter permease [Scardovia wiggsiae]|uniref:amino acid ABC transporter permease n=1 Tax=Scardovia wiggsiae TaxID=230143 RepID=UPI00374F4F61